MGTIIYLVNSHISVKNATKTIIQLRQERICLWTNRKKKNLAGKSQDISKFILHFFPTTVKALTNPLVNLASTKLFSVLTSATSTGKSNSATLFSLSLIKRDKKEKKQ